jgi:hypothetical protein
MKCKNVSFDIGLKNTLVLYILSVIEAMFILLLV